MSATPTTWRMLLEAGWRGSPGLTACAGGEPLTAELARQLLPRTAALWNLYGPTETTVFSTLEAVTDPGRITIGRPIANTQVYVLDDRMRPQPAGLAGEICIGGAGVADGYAGRPGQPHGRRVPPGAAVGARPVEQGLPPAAQPGSAARDPPHGAERPALPDREP